MIIFNARCNSTFIDTLSFYVGGKLIERIVLLKCRSNKKNRMSIIFADTKDAQVQQNG